MFKHGRNRMHTVRIEMLAERIYYYCACAVLRSSLTNVCSGQCREQRATLLPIMLYAQENVLPSASTLDVY